jgi:Putative metal-binding motif
VGATRAVDCDDADLYVFPGATERCNRKDDNCSSDGGAEPLEDLDEDGHTSLSYGACEGGFPKDDCVDSNQDVFLGQTKWFDDFYCEAGYPRCSDSTAPAMTWCSGVKGSCSPKPTNPYITPLPKPKIWDYNCSGVDEARDMPTFESACSAAFNTGCDVDSVPVTGACGLHLYE